MEKASPPPGTLRQMPAAEPPPAPLDRLRAAGFDVLCTSHAAAILSVDFPDALNDLAGVLDGFTIAAEELVRGGGGEAPFTQRLRKSLVDKGWRKREFTIRKLIDDAESQATSHEVDHVKAFPAGTVALEIEWNNKDPFFDRDLDNFKRLHADGGIGVGVIITRGVSLQASLRDLLHDFVVRRGITDLDGLSPFDYAPTPRQQALIEKRLKRGEAFADAWVTVFYSDKFGKPTTHWRKLADRVNRGAGNPCPLLLIGLPRTIVKA